MIRKILIPILFLPVYAWGQFSSKNIYQQIKGVMLVDSVSLQAIAGDFSVSNGFWGYNYQLDINKKFEKISFNCVYDGKIDSGSWKIKNGHALVLQSARRKVSFDIVKFDLFCFLIRPLQRHSFIKDLKALRKEYENIKSGKAAETAYSTDYFVGFNLRKKYYAKEIAKAEDDNKDAVTVIGQSN